MGFYIHICIQFNIDQTTGKPTLSSVEVPEQYRRFLNEKGSHYNYYVLDDDTHIHNTSNLYNNFPRWEDIYENLSDKEKNNWTEEDHNLLHEAMKWFSEQNEHYVVYFG